MKKLNKFEDRPNLYDYLKIVALITMIIDHIWYYVLPEYSFLRVIWRIAFPIFLFLVWFSWSYKWRRDIPIIGLILWYISYYFSEKYWYCSSSANILIWITISRFFINIINKNNWRLAIIISLLFIIIHPFLNKYIDYWSLSFFFALRWRIARYHKKYFFLWIIPLIWCIINSINVFDFWFRHWDYKFLFIISFTFLIFYLLSYILSKENINLQTWKKLRDTIILGFSKHALDIYWIHIIILNFIWLYRFWFI